MGYIWWMSFPNLHSPFGKHVFLRKSRRAMKRDPLQALGLFCTAVAQYSNERNAKWTPPSFAKGGVISTANRGEHIIPRRDQ